MSGALAADEGTEPGAPADPGPSLRTWLVAGLCFLGAAAVTAVLVQSDVDWSSGKDGGAPDDVVMAFVLIVGGLAASGGFLIGSEQRGKGKSAGLPHVRRWTALAGVLSVLGSVAGAGLVMAAGPMSGVLEPTARMGMLCGLLLIGPVTWSAWKTAKTRGLAPGRQVQFPQSLTPSHFRQQAHQPSDHKQWKQRLNARHWVRFSAICCLGAAALVVLMAVEESANSVSAAGVVLVVATTLACVAAAACLLLAELNAVSPVRHLYFLRKLLAVSAPALVIAPAVLGLAPSWIWGTDPYGDVGAVAILPAMGFLPVTFASGLCLWLLAVTPEDDTEPDLESEAEPPGRTAAEGE